MRYSVSHEGEEKKKTCVPTGIEPMHDVPCTVILIADEDSDLFFVPCTWHTKFYIFSYFFTELIIYHVSFFFSLA